jgi:hypothetical protein
MKFNLEKLFVSVFAPQDEVVTLMYDLPTVDISDNDKWRARREMVTQWHREIVKFAKKYKMAVNPLLTYKATGGHNRDLPEYGMSGGKRTKIGDCMLNSTIVISMPEFSASAPLIIYTQRKADLRVASMPMVNKAMEQTGLSADYKRIAEECIILAQLFEKAIGIDVVFSTGHSCYFDTSDNKTPIQDNGFLHRGMGKGAFRLRNLLSGEVGLTPNESTDSKTEGRLPIAIDEDIVVVNVRR